MGLTEKQRDALAFIEAYAASHGGVSPTYQEIGTGLGLASKAGVSRILKALAERGYVTERRKRARSIEVIRSLQGPGNMPRYQKINDMVHRHYAMLHPPPDRLALEALDRVSLMLLTAGDDRDLIRRMRLLASTLQNAALEIAR